MSQQMTVTFPRGKRVARPATTTSDHRPTRATEERRRGLGPGAVRPVPGLAGTCAGYYVLSFCCERGIRPRRHQSGAAMGARIRRQDLHHPASTSWCPTAFPRSTTPPSSAPPTSARSRRPWRARPGSKCRPWWRSSPDAPLRRLPCRLVDPQSPTRARPVVAAGFQPAGRVGGCPLGRASRLPKASPPTHLAGRMPAATMGAPPADSSANHIGDTRLRSRGGMACRLSGANPTRGCAQRILVGGSAALARPAPLGRERPAGGRCGPLPYSSSALFEMGPR